MLHIINNFPVDCAELEKTHSGDTILFLENAVFALKKCDQSLYMLKKKALSHLNLCVRKADLTNRGLSFNEIAGNVAIIDDRDYFTITKQDAAIRSWN